jgi:1,4-alpha-glucan branching enzyme
MEELTGRFADADGVILRALKQAGRELLLAQSSDWAFIMKTGTMVDYAVKRTKDHVYRFTRLYEQLLSGNLDFGWLKEIEDKDNIFTNLDHRNLS